MTGNGISVDTIKVSLAAFTYKDDIKQAKTIGIEEEKMTRLRLDAPDLA